MVENLKEDTYYFQKLSRPTHYPTVSRIRPEGLTLCKPTLNCRKLLLFCLTISFGRALLVPSIEK